MNMISLENQLHSVKLALGVESDLKRETINAHLRTVTEVTVESIRDALEISAIVERKLDLIAAIIDHPEFMELVEAGKITYAMVKPSAHESVDFDGTDDDIADKVLESIEEPLQVLFSHPIWIPTGEAEVFYAHVAKYGDDVFESVTTHMTGGATTAVILYHPVGEAIQEWRRQIGPTKIIDQIEQNRKDSIRYRFRTSNESNNTVHGSDSVDAVKNELEFLKRLLALQLPA